MLSRGGRWLKPNTLAFEQCYLQVLAELKILLPELLSYLHFKRNGASFRWLKSVFSGKKGLIHIWGWLKIIFVGNKLQ